MVSRNKQTNEVQRGLGEKERLTANQILRNVRLFILSYIGSAVDLQSASLGYFIKRFKSRVSSHSFASFGQVIDEQALYYTLMNK